MPAKISHRHLGPIAELKASVRNRETVAVSKMVRRLERAGAEVLTTEHGVGVSLFGNHVLIRDKKDLPHWRQREILKAVGIRA